MQEALAQGIPGTHAAIRGQVSQHVQGLVAADGGLVHPRPPRQQGPVAVPLQGNIRPSGQPPPLKQGYPALMRKRTSRDSLQRMARPRPPGRPEPVAVRLHCNVRPSQRHCMATRILAEGALGPAQSRGCQHGPSCHKRVNTASASWPWAVCSHGCKGTAPSLQAYHKSSSCELTRPRPLLNASAALGICRPACWLPPSHC